MKKETIQGLQFEIKKASPKEYLQYKTNDFNNTPNTHCIIFDEVHYNFDKSNFVLKIDKSSEYFDHLFDAFNSALKEIFHYLLKDRKLAKEYAQKYIIKNFQEIHTGIEVTKNVKLLYVPLLCILNTLKEHYSLAFGKIQTEYYKYYLFSGLNKYYLCHLPDYSNGTWKKVLSDTIKKDDCLIHYTLNLDNRNYNNYEKINENKLCFILNKKFK